MKYIYYTIATLLLLTVILAIPFKKFKVEVSKPAIVINDRIITQRELDRLLHEPSQSNHTAGAIDAIITNELLIQEALAQEINREESFRVSVESFYEQSLVKILIDRKFASLDPEIPEEMVDRFAMLEGQNLDYSMLVYDSRQAVEQREFESRKTISANFDNLADELKFLLVQTEPGKISDAVKTEKKFICYTLDSEMPEDKLSNILNMPVDKINEIRELLIQQKKGLLFARWMDDLTEKAEIQILREE